MSATHIECPFCGKEGKIDDQVVGHQIKCPKCGASFVAEVGGTYDLADTSPSPPADAPAPRRRRSTQAEPVRPDPVKPKQEEADDWPRKSWLEEWPQE